MQELGKSLGGMNVDKVAFRQWFIGKYDRWFVERKSNAAPRLLKHFATWIGLPFETVRAWLNSDTPLDLPTFEQLQALINCFGMAETLTLFQTDNDYRLYLIIQGWGNLPAPARKELFLQFLHGLENATQPFVKIKMQ